MTPQRIEIDLGQGESLAVMASFDASGELRDIWPIRDGLRGRARAGEAAHTIDTLGGLLRSDGWNLAGIEARARLHVDVLGRLRAALRDAPPQPGR